MISIISQCNQNHSVIVLFGVNRRKFQVVPYFISICVCVCEFFFLYHNSYNNNILRKTLICNFPLNFSKEHQSLNAYA